MATCTIPTHNNDADGDNLYAPRTCWQEFVDWAWQAYGFQNAYWKNGFGYFDACNRDRPLNRTMNGLWLLCYSAEDYENDDYSNNALHWGRRYTWNQIDELRAFCGDGDAIASASGSRVDLFLGFWYNQSVPVRASTFVHEARHLGGKSHNANFPSGSVFGAGDSGADSSWEYEGAWMFEALYLWWFYADGRRTTQAMRDLAREEANLYIDNAFATHPGFTVA